MPFVVNGGNVVGPLHHRKAAQRPEVDRIGTRFSVFSPRSARNFPPRRGPTRNANTDPRLIIAEETFRRLAVHFTGRPIARGPGHERNSGEKALRVPKFPPISQTARHCSFSTPRVTARRSRNMRTPAGGGAQCIEILVFVIFPNDGTRLHRTSVTRWIRLSDRTMWAARSKAADVAFASPTSQVRAMFDAQPVQICGAPISIDVLGSVTAGRARNRLR